jgi:hypothetical protein
VIMIPGEHLRMKVAWTKTSSSWINIITNYALLNVPERFIVVSIYVISTSFLESTASPGSA